MHQSTSSLGIARIKPFLKWAGGKRWLMSSKVLNIPAQFNTYHEPFVGGGSMFFRLTPKSAYLSDINSELIRTYASICENPGAVRKKLLAHARNHCADYYYQIRSQRPRSESGIAARFIYLNRTCWNGLYRVNLKGKFNVPKGSKDRVIFADDDFETVAKTLKQAKLHNLSYRESLKFVQDQDFVFLDPPYTVKHNANGFVKYNEVLFSWKDQEMLAGMVKEIDKRGAKFLLSNADHESIRELYPDFSITSVPRSSVISGSKDSRAVVNELLISNY